MGAERHFSGSLRQHTDNTTVENDPVGYSLLHCDLLCQSGSELNCFIILSAHLQWGWPQMLFQLWWHQPESGFRVWIRPPCSEPRLWMPVGGGANVHVWAFHLRTGWAAFIDHVNFPVCNWLVLFKESNTRFKILNSTLKIKKWHRTAAFVWRFGRGNYQVMTQGRGIIHISQVSLSLLDSLHAAVDGPHQGLLGQTLLTATWQRYTINKSEHSLTAASFFF